MNMTVETLGNSPARPPEIPPLPVLLLCFTFQFPKCHLPTDMRRKMKVEILWNTHIDIYKHSTYMS